MGKRNTNEGTLVNFSDGGVGADYIKGKMPEDQRIKMIGKKHSTETKNKMSISHKGKTLSLSQLIFLKRRGMNHIIPKTRKIHQLTLDNSFIKEWNSIQECCNELGTMHSMIVHCCRGRKKTHKGFKWIYSDSDSFSQS